MRSVDLFLVEKTGGESGDYRRRSQANDHGHRFDCQRFWGIRLTGKMHPALLSVNDARTGVAGHADSPSAGVQHDAIQEQLAGGQIPWLRR